ncbi:MAG TPA: hypothetical protein VG276_06100 [Actinomycetes bacterium]|jgi:hypothetical protein|nr:hypothetical protein [Actinomycetes bacterium]
MLAILSGEPAAIAVAAALPAGLAWAAVRLGRRKDRAEAFARAGRRWLGPSELIFFTHRTEAGRAALAHAGAQSIDYETSTRKVWI